MATAKDNKVQYEVKSERDGRKHYIVTGKGGKRKQWSCNCPHFIYRKPKGGCKHIQAVK